MRQPRTQKTEPVDWTQEITQDFQAIKKNDLTMATAIGPGKTFYLVCD
jgi:hypothetical protein